MSHFTSKSPFQGTLCGKRVRGAAARDEHEAQCAECKRNQEILERQVRS